MVNGIFVWKIDFYYCKKMPVASKIENTKIMIDAFMVIWPSFFWKGYMWLRNKMHVQLKSKRQLKSIMLTPLATFTCMV